MKERNGIGDKPPEEYDTSEFQGYILSVLPEVLFRIAWIHHNNELVAEIYDYENAVTLITTF